MKQKNHSKSVNGELIGNSEHADREKAAMQEFEDSSEYYERRSKIRFKWQQGDWWIAIGLYMVLVGVAFIVL